MNTPIKTLITKLNQTDYDYQAHNTPELAYERASIRLELANFSQKSQEKQLFINQAVVILEQALMGFDELALNMHIQLSLLLGECYLSLYHLTQKTPYLTIAEQIIKPLSHHNYQVIYEKLATIHQLQNKPKLSQHWQTKAKTAKVFSVFDLYTTCGTVQ